MNLRERRKAKRIVILCEGDTEVIAVKEFIFKKWKEDGFSSIGLMPKKIKAQLKEIHVQTPLFLKDDKVLAVFTLVDLYGFKRVNLKHTSKLEDRIEAAKEWLKNEFSQKTLTKFYPHLSVHEVEAWIIAEGKALSHKLKVKSIRAKKNAEEINDQKPPKKRLNELFHRYLKNSDGYKEKRDATPLFGKLNFLAVYNSCPNFKNFYDELKSVAQNALE